MAFSPRTTAPSRTASYYLCTAYQQTQRYGYVVRSGGLNEAIVGHNSTDGSALPNCVGYAWGRWYEILGTRPNLSLGNANLWYSYNDGYTHRKTNPTVGSVCCFSTQHVNVIEKEISSTEYLTSGSYWGTTGSSKDFVLEKLIYNSSSSTWERWSCSQSSPYTTGSKFGSAYQGFQGFIILPITDPDNTLEDIAISGVGVVFDPDQFDYTYTTYQQTSAITYSKKYSGQTVTCYVNGTVVSQAESFDFVEGENIVFVYCRRQVSGTYYTTQYKFTIYYGTEPTEIPDTHIENVNIGGTDFQYQFSEFNFNYEYNLIGESNRIYVTAKDEEATITVQLNGSNLVVGDGYVSARAYWEAGENNIYINCAKIGGTEEEPVVYEDHYYITIYSATSLELISFVLYTDSDKTNQVELNPEFTSEASEYSATIKNIYRLWDNYLLDDDRAWMTLTVNGVAYASPRRNGFPLNKGKNTIKLYVSGYSYDGETIEYNIFTIIVYVRYNTFKVIYATRIL